MKRVIVALLVLQSVAAAGQSAFVQNNTDMTLYLRASVDMPFRQVPSGGVLPVEPGLTYEGFAFAQGSFSLPSVRVSAASSAASVVSVGERDLSYAVAVDPASVAETLSAPRIDNRYLEWLPLEPLFALAKGRSPLGVFINGGTGRTPVLLADAQQWQRAGTDLEWLKTRKIGEDLFFAVSSYSAFARNSSVSLFLYTDSDFPYATVDAAVGEGDGYIFLWLPTEPQPYVIGNLLAGEFFAEGQIWLDVLDDLVPGRALPVDETTVEFATLTSASGVWEEFVLARLPLRALIP